MPVAVLKHYAIDDGLEVGVLVGIYGVTDMSEVFPEFFVSRESL